ncbi:DEKNAAC101221 [Brettanomyces naardenensis]|uniref:GTPase-activating protein GYP5 n=1 Tax=Brettanomyces naardenensis TaxID=13370 RepID=A0A448YH59_BRENA|nr:DEKNAAC101221 [Brettanomyces naardenensis]
MSETENTVDPDTEKIVEEALKEELANEEGVKDETGEGEVTPLSEGTDENVRKTTAAETVEESTSETSHDNTNIPKPTTQLSEESSRLHRPMRKMTDAELRLQSDDKAKIQRKGTEEKELKSELGDSSDIAEEVAPVSPEKQDSAGSSNAVDNLRKWFSFVKVDGEVDTVMKRLQQGENYDLALSRFKENNVALLSQPRKDQEAVNSCADNLRKTFNEIKTGIEFSHDEMLIQGIDWEFWSQVVNDYSAVVNERPKDLLGHISEGIPKELRGMVWQLICSSKSLQLEEFYRNSKRSNSSYEKLIKRDLARTSFVTESEVSSKIEELFDIIKSYSLYDKEVGYTQGMAFITVPLLMNMDASEAFCMLAKLMDNYGFRELYLPEMPGLHLKLYQFDRLIEDVLPELYLHLQRQGVRSSMYATQWFLTLFGYKFPLDMVLRIYDVVIAEGIESILGFALNLMARNSEKLLKLRFDQLLRFLKEEIFYYYLDKEAGDDGEITAKSYRLDDFVKDSMSVKILPMMLNRYKAEFDEIQRLERERKKEVESVRTQNSELLKEIRQIEAAYATLNKEHVVIANEMVEGKVAIANVREENQQLKDRAEETIKRLANLDNQKDTHVDFRGEISNSLDLEIQKTMQRNSEVMNENELLEEKLGELESERERLKEEVSRHSGWSLRPKKTFW